jgi:hypothetical protein
MINKSQVLIFKEINMKTIYALILALFIGCSAASQFTFYQPDQDIQSWRVAISQSRIGNSFECKINDFKVMDESFGFYSDSFEKEDYYQGKKIIMSGYRKNAAVPGGSVTYTIRVFIDKKEAAKFDF